MEVRQLRHLLRWHDPRDVTGCLEGSVLALVDDVVADPNRCATGCRVRSGLAHHHDVVVGDVELHRDAACLADEVALGHDRTALDGELIVGERDTSRFTQTAKPSAVAPATVAVP